MITIDIRGLDAVQSKLRNLAAEQIPYAMMITINNTAFAVQKTSRTRLQTAFDRPTPLIQGATRVEKATKETLTGKVYIDPGRVVVLGRHEIGGERGQKSFERKIGLPTIWKAVPTDKMPRNQYGNPDSKINRRILDAKNGKSRGIYFIMPGIRSSQSPGIYQLVSSTKINKLYHFVKRAQYEARLDWAETVKKEALRLLPGEADKAVQRALETSRLR